MLTMEHVNQRVEQYKIKNKLRGHYCLTELVEKYFDIIPFVNQCVDLDVGIIERSLSNILLNDVAEKQVLNLLHKLGHDRIINKIIILSVSREKYNNHFIKNLENVYLEIYTMEVCLDFLL